VKLAALEALTLELAGQVRRMAAGERPDDAEGLRGLTQTLGERGAQR